MEDGGWRMDEEDRIGWNDDGGGMEDKEYEEGGVLEQEMKMRMVDLVHQQLLTSAASCHKAEESVPAVPLIL